MYNRKKHMAAAKALSLKQLYKDRGYKIFSPYLNRMDFIAESPAEPVTGLYIKAMVWISDSIVHERIINGWK